MIGKLLHDGTQFMFHFTKWYKRRTGHARRYGKSSKPKVYLTRRINKAAYARLKEYCDVESWNKKEEPVPRVELLKNIPGKDALFCLLTDKIDQEVVEAGDKLKVVATMCTGFEHLDLPAMYKRKIRVGTTFGVMDATAELTVTLVLATGRRIFEAQEAARCGGWATWSPFWMCGPGIKDQTIGMVGTGAIGGETLRRIYPFKPKDILYYNLVSRPDLEEDICAKKASFDEILKNSDYVITCLAYNKNTANIFNAEAFSKMKENAIFINTARGGLVDQEALITALKEKRIRGAGLDSTVPEPLPLDSPLLKMKNVVILPHVGSATFNARNDMADITVTNIILGLKGEKMPMELKEQGK